MQAFYGIQYHPVLFINFYVNGSEERKPIDSNGYSYARSLRIAGFDPNTLYNATNPIDIPAAIQR